jgi:autotransporter-associated beta strand protein
MKKSTTLIKALAAVALLGISSPLVFAASTDTWVGGSANFSTTANWSYSSGSGPLASGDSLIFGSTGSTSPNNDITSLSVNNLTINTGASAFTFGGNGLTLNGTLTDNASATETFGSGIVLGPFFTAIKKTVSGTLDLRALTRTAGNGGSVNFTPTGTIHTTTANNNGILGGWATVGNAGTTGASGDWAAVDGSGNIITYASYTTISGSTTGSGASALNWLDTDGTASLTASAPVNSLVMRGDFNIQSGATLTLGSGGLLFSGASKWLKNNGAGSIAGSAQITSGLASGELFVDSSGSGGTGDNDWQIWPKIINNGGTAVILVKNGPGYVGLQNANTNTGATIVNGGELAFITAMSGNYGGNITVASGATLSSTANNTFGNPPTGTWTIAGTLKAASAANLTDFVLPANVTLNNGTMTSIANTSAYGAFDVNAASTVITANGSANTINAVAIGLEQALTFTTPLSTDALAVSSILGTSSAKIVGVTKNGLGTVTLSGANTYTGGTTVSAGTLSLGSTTAIGTGTLTMNGGNLDSSVASLVNANNNAQAWNADFTFVGSQSLNLGSGNVTLGASRQVTVTANTLTVGGIVSGSGYSLTKAGSGTLTLSGANTYTGATVVNGGTLQMNSANATTPSVTVNNGGTLALNIADALGFTAGKDVPTINSGGTINNITSASRVTLWNGLTMTGGTLTGAATVVSDANGEYSLSGTVTATSDANGTAATISGTPISLQNQNVANGSITFNVTRGSATPASDLNVSANLVPNSNAANIGLAKSGTGIMTLSGANTYTGGTTVNAGTLALSGSGTLGSSAALTLGGGTLDLGNLSPTVGAVSITSAAGSGNTIQNGSLTGTSYAASLTTGNAIVTANLLGSGVGMTKTGAGTLTLSGANTYTGSTVVRSGTLSLSGTTKTTTGGLYIVDNNAASTGNAKVNISATSPFLQIWLGDRAGSTPLQCGAVYQSAGTVTLSQAANVDNLRVGSVAGGNGYYNLSGGTLNVNEVGVGASQGGTIGVMDITGGTFTDNGYIYIARGDTTSSGLLNVLDSASGTSVTGTRIETLGVSTTTGIAMLNVGGGTGTASVSTTGSATLGLNLASASTSSSAIGIANLLTGGTLNVGIVTASTAQPTTALNFNGGTLKATTVNAGGSFLTSANVDNVYVCSGGGTVDNNGQSITISRPLLAPTSTGVTTISGPTTPGSGYVGAPLVTITGGTATTPATAYAVMADDGTGNGTYKVSSIVVTSPGVYTVAPTTVMLTGGGSSSASGFTINTGANTSGGMTFADSGAAATTTLSGPNTYSGGTIINAGTVALSGSGTLGSAANALTINAGTLDLGTLTSPTAGAVIISGGTIQNGTLTASTSYAANNSGAATVSAKLAGSVALTKSGSGTLTLSGANTYTGATTISAGTLEVATAGTGIASGSATTVNSPGTLQVDSGATVAGTVTVAAGGTLSGAGTVGGLVTLSGTGSAINLNNGTAATLTLNNGLTLNGGNVLNFDVAGATTSDKIAVTGTYTPPSSGTVTINFNNIGIASVTTINLITTSGTMDETKFTVGTPASGFTQTLQHSGGNLQVVFTPNAPLAAFWKGGVDNNWGTADGASFNWATAAAGTVSTGGKPGLGTAVTFSVTGVNSPATTLDANYEIGSLTFTSTGSVGISGSHTLQDDGGITVNSGAGPVSISATSFVLGGDQVVADNSSSALNISSPISGAHTMTVNSSGSGTTTLSGANSHSGTTVSAGTLALSGSGTLGSSSAAVTASGGTLNLGATSQTVGTVTVSGGTVQNGTLTGTSYALQSGAVSAVLAGSSIAATKTTSGTLTLSGANTYTGGTTISAGTLKLGAANAVPGNTYAGDVSVTGTLDLFGYSDAINGLNGAGTVDTTASSGTPTLTLGANGDGGSFSGVIQNTAGTLALIKSGAGTLTLSSGSSTYSGGTTLNAGQITLGASSTGSGNSVTSGPLGTSTVTLSGGTLQMNNKTLGNNLSASASTTTIIDNSVGDATLSGNVSGAGTITIQNSSSTGLSDGASGDWSGFTGTLNYTPSSATLNLSLAANADLSHAAVNTSFQTSSSLKLGTGTTKFGSLSGNGTLGLFGSVLEIGNLNANTTYSGVMSSASALTKTGTGALTLSGANSYTSTTTVDNGSLIAGAAVSVSANGPFGNASSAIALGDATSISGNLSPSLFIGGAYTMARTVTVGANNTATTGIYTLGGNTANSSTFSGLITLNQSLTVTQATSGTLNITAGITSGSSGTQTVTVNNPGAVNVGTTGIGGGTGTIALTKTGSGTLTLSGANTYSGGTTLSAGTLNFGSATALGTGTVTLNTGTIQAGGAFTLANNLTVSGSSSFDIAGNNTTVSGNLNGSAALNLNNSGGAATVTLNGNNSSYGGTITFNTGNAVSFASANAGSASAAWVFNDNAADRVRINIAGGGTINFGSISGSGQMQNDTSGTASIISVGALNTPTTFSGTITNGTGTLALTKVGSGSLTLSGGNTYTGNTTISGGTLALSGSGSLASPNISVATGATFDVSALSSYALNGSGTLTMGIDKTSGTRTQGQMVLGSKNITYSGALTVNKTGSDTLASGDSFTLVSGSGTFGGWFSSVTVPTLASGLSWDTNKLATTGVLDIYSFTTTTLTLSTPKNTAATISAAKLQNHATTLRGTPHVATVTSPANGGASVSSGILTYTPNTGYTGSDTFTCTFQDGHGWQTMTVNVTVGNGASQSPNLLASGTTNGNFFANFAGIPGTQYTVEKTASLSPASWTKLGNYTAPTDNTTYGLGVGVFQVLDPVSSGSGYYRTVYPSY